MELAIAALLALYGLLWLATRPRDTRLGWFVGASLASLLLLPPSLEVGGRVGSVLGPLAALSFAAAGLLLTGRRPKWPRHYWLLALVAALSAGGAIVRSQEDPYALFVTACALLLPLALGDALDADLFILRRWIIGLGLLLAVACAVEGLLIGRPLFVDVAYGMNPIIEGTIRGQATAGHPLVAGTFILIAATVLVLGPARAPSKILGSTVATVGVVTTGSSSALVIAATGLALAWIILGTDNTRRFSRAALVGVAGLLAYKVLLPEGIASDLSGQNASHRINSILAVPNLIFERPLLESLFGSGSGSVGDLFREGIFANDGFFTIDNQYVSVLATAGLVGLFAFALFVWRIIRSTRNRIGIALVAAAAMLLSFDVLAWASTSFLIAALVEMTQRTPVTANDASTTPTARPAAAPLR